MSELNDLQKVQLDILRELDRVCNENELKYYLAFGTCLGALRHKGFIPWDDDIDVLMSYEDAKKLLKIRRKFKKKYFLQSKETDPNYESIALRLRDSETTLIEKEDKDLDINHGIYVDIYPFYNAPISKIGLLINIWRSYLLKILVAGREPYNHGVVMKYATRVVLWLFRNSNKKRIIRYLEHKLAEVKEGKEILDYYGQDITLFSAITYPIEWFGEPKKVLFEGEYFNAATEPEKYMTRRYRDYMKLPPKEDQVKHHSYVYMNAHKSYRDYIKE